MLCALTALLALPAHALTPFPDDELLVFDQRVVAVVDGGTYWEVDVLADLQNLDIGALSNVTATLMVPTSPRWIVLADTLTFGTVGPLGVVSADPLAPVRIRIDKALSGPAAACLASDCLPFGLSGKEDTVYQVGVEPVLPELVTAYLGAGNDGVDEYVEFDGWTAQLLALTPGDILVFEDPHDDTTGCADTLFGTDCPPHMLSAPQVPWEVLGVADVGYDIIRLRYLPRPDLDLTALLVSGYVSGGASVAGTAMKNSAEHGFPDMRCNEWPDGSLKVDSTGPDCEFAGRFVPFNGRSIGATSTAQGGASLKGISAGLGVRVRGSMPRKTGASFTITHDTTALVHAGGAEVAAPFHADLWNHVIPLPAVPIGGVPVDLELVVDLDLDIEATLSGPGSAGLTQRGTFGVEMDYDHVSGAYVMQPVAEVEPLHSNDPTLVSGAAMDLRTAFTVDVQLRGLLGTLGGPSVTGTAWTELAVDPVASPWWELTAGADLVGTLELDAVGFTVASHTYPLVSTPVASIGAASAPFTEDPGFSAGPTTRWAVDLDHVDVTGDYPADVLDLGGGDLAVVSRSPGVVTALDPLGNKVWQTQAGTATLGGVVPSAAGLIAVGQENNKLFIGLMDNAGVPVQQHAWWAGGGFAVSKVVPLSAGTAPELLMLGTTLVSGRYSAFAARVTYDTADPVDPLTVTWARTYRTPTGLIPYADSFADGVLTSGGVAVVGQTSEGLTYGASAGLLDLATGDVLWAKKFQTGERFRGVEMLPDGWLLAVGKRDGNGVVAPFEYHTFWMVKIDPATGLHGAVAGYAEDLCCSSAYTTPGASVYDTAEDVVLLADGTVALTGWTALTNASNLFVLRVDQSLNALWMLTVEGDGEDRGMYLTDSGDGIVVLGQTTSPGQHGLGRTDLDLLVLKLPYEGGIAMSPTSAMTVRYDKPDATPPAWNTIDPLGASNLGWAVADLPLALSTTSNVLVPVVHGSWDVDANPR